MDIMPVSTTPANATPLYHEQRQRHWHGTAQRNLFIP